MTDHDNTFKHGLDIAFAAVVGGAWLNLLPTVATVLGIVWYLLRIWESETVKQLTGRPITNRDWVDTMTFRKVRETQQPKTYVEDGVLKVREPQDAERK
jgi:hypothetical protein